VNITVLNVADAQAMIDAPRTRDGKHVVWFREVIDWLAENANGECVPINLLDQTTDDGEPLGTSAASLASVYSTKVKQYRKENPDFPLRVIKRKANGNEKLTHDSDGFVCLLVYN
jgi:hypothetical protein